MPATTSLPPEKLEQLKQVIHSHLSSNGTCTARATTACIRARGLAVTDTYGKLREFVRNFVKEQAPGGRIEEHEVLPTRRPSAQSALTADATPVPD